MTESRLIYRHRLWVRITHWINVVCMTVLLMSGLQIFNAHPTLYWGSASNFDDPLAMIGVFPDWATLPGSASWRSTKGSSRLRLLPACVAAKAIQPSSQ